MRRDLGEAEGEEKEKRMIRVALKYEQVSHGESKKEMNTK